MSNEYSHDQNISVPPYNQKNRDHMRQLLQTAPPLIDLIASGRVPFARRTPLILLIIWPALLNISPTGTWMKMLLRS